MVLNRCFCDVYFSGEVAGVTAMRVVYPMDPAVMGGSVGAVETLVSTISVVALLVVTVLVSVAHCCEDL